MAFKPYNPVAAHEARMNAQADADWRRQNPDPTKVPTMPHVSQMIVSKYIGHAEVDPPLAVTIRALSLENVARQGAEEEQRWIMWFNELKKGLRLNVTNLRILEAAYGSQSEAWVGHRIQLYWDPTVQFGGKLVGGVRFRVGRAAVGGSNAAPPGARFDPMTGKPLAPQFGGKLVGGVRFRVGRAAVGGSNAAPPGARFDPMTGKPLAPPPAATPRFDPMTGLPLGGAGAPAAPVARFDPQTGLPITQAQPAAQAPSAVDAGTGEILPGGIDPEFDDDIPF